MIMMYQNDKIHDTHESERNRRYYYQIMGTERIPEQIRNIAFKLNGKKAANKSHEAMYTKLMPTANIRLASKL